MPQPKTTKPKPRRAPAGGRQTAKQKKATESAKASTIPTPPKLVGGAAKLAWIQQHLTTNVIKTGRNEHHRYDYFQEHGILDLLKPFLEKVGAGYIIDFQDITAEGNHTRGILAITVFDMNLSRDDVNWGVTERYPGEATDSQDKGSNKLMTTAVKYALQKAFSIPTEALEDTDADSNGGSPESKAPAKPKAIAAKKAAALRATAAQAVDDQKIDAKAVTAFLTSEFRKNKITDLTAQEGEVFETWLTEQVGS
jgi:ERF superfamily